MSHLSADQLSAYIDGALTDHDREEAERHFASCTECLRELAEMARLHRQLDTSMSHDPGEAYFDSFAGRVQERIRSEGGGVHVPTPNVGSYRRGPTLLDRLGYWFSGPRLAWAGTVAAVVIGAGVVFMISREAPIPARPGADLQTRSNQVEERAGSAPRPATPLTAKREDGAKSKLDDQAGPSSEVAVDQVREPVETKEADARIRGGETSDKDAAGSAPADEGVTQTGAVGATGSLFASPPPDAGKTSTAPTVGLDKSAVEKSRAQEMRRGEGESVPAAGTQTKIAPSVPQPSPSAAKLTSPSQDASARVKNQQARQAAEPLQSSAANRVCGTVRDDSGRPLSGAQVVIADLGVTARSDASGRFCIEAPAGTHTLAALAVGFNESRREVEVGPGAPSVDFTLAAVPVLADAKRTVTWPESARDLAEDAERGTRRALASNTAASWDSVALQWSKTAAAVSGGDAMIRARASLAEARYRAWKLSPTPGRTGVAAAALQSYLEVAPQGAERRKVQQRLNEVEQR